MATFDVDDQKSFEDNCQDYGATLSDLDSVLGPILATEIPRLLAGDTSKAEIWDLCLAALEAEGKA